MISHDSNMSSDYSDDSEDLVIIGEKSSKSDKGKAVEANHQIMVCISCYFSFLAVD